MSILGKLLIVFNLLAAGAFAYLTLENYKVRHNLTTQALTRDIALGGLPVEPSDPPIKVDSDRVAFPYQSGGSQVESIAKKDLVRLLPPGGDLYGNTEGELIPDQTAEVKRVQKKVFGTSVIPAFDVGNPKPRFDWLRAYLLNLARSGAERDGVLALFDLRDPTRSGPARRDLPYLARTPSQVAALAAMVAVADLGDPQGIAPANVQASRILVAREAVKQFLIGEAAHGPADQEGQQRLKNAIIDAFEAKGAAGRVKEAAGGAKGWDDLGDVAAEPLTDKASADKAIKALLAYATTKANSATPTEAAALAGIGTLVSPPPLGFNLDATIDAVATNLLNHKFDEAAQPGAKSSGAANTAGEKARKIAHVLYHLDAHRHGLRDEATVSARKEWHNRVAAVVGLQEYVRAAEAQASEYAEASSRLLAAITEEQSAFEAEYQAQVQRVQFLFTQWLTQDAAFKVQDAITNENVRLMGERETERNNLKEDLKSSIQKAKEALAKLSATQSQLFAIQKQLRDAQAALFTLEQELRRLELSDKVGSRR